jgi:hypothetical protein
MQLPLTGNSSLQGTYKVCIVVLQPLLWAS